MLFILVLNLLLFVKGTGKDGAVQLHPWQLKALSALKLVGEAADLQLHIGGTAIVDPRLLAAVRILFLSDASKVGCPSLDMWSVS